jgi:quinol monooxygenase YgiN
MLGMTQTARRLNQADFAAARGEAKVCMIVRGEAREGADEAVEQLLADFAHMVRAHEPGCRGYFIARAVGSRLHFAAHARFNGWIALRRHAASKHMQDLLPHLMAQLAAPVSLEVFLEV